MSKKLLSILLAIAIVLTISPVTVIAEDDVLSYLTYEITDGEVTITDCDQSISGDVVIPDTIEGYPVTIIGDYAFYNCTSLTDVYYSGSETDWANISIDDYKDCLTSATIHYNCVIEEPTTAEPITEEPTTETPTTE